MNYPTAWDEFQETWDNRGKEERIAMSRFGARYRIARSLNSVTFDTSISPDLAAAYSSAIKLSMAYCALDILEKISPSYTKIKLFDRKLLEAYRKMPTLHEFLHENITNKKLRPSLQSLYSGHSLDMNIRPIADAIRHLTLHGILTPNGAGMKTSADVVFLDRLTDVILQTSDAGFSSKVPRAT